ncbi:Putative P-loop containing nucleoside triphosphate hydrolase [Septoria linicola]|uniref:P-loop containing nucleoside triphosphate hydrolase n=1 Tax=Septoria linicola TaxID=215465 RepID=A0A9Q9EQQ8_9PEZI|nr:putative P-loop containing nucleoside triphosphate hydrolase [Septoria linicola]USW59072.1 Putative P-loop containing nucleoside triphosphate hydrolase [Septoria linicola]
MAGTGKSTIAMTVCQSLLHSGHHVGTFFFEPGAGNLASTDKLLFTVAYQLAINWPGFRHELAGAFRTDPNISHLSMDTQYQQLLLLPMKRSRRKESIVRRAVIVLDALDECDDPGDVQALLHLFSELKSFNRLGLRVLITSPPDWMIRSMSRDAPAVFHEELQLHKSEFRASTASDIEKFMRHELQDLALKRRLPLPWPKEHELQALVHRSAGGFIYAATCCRYTRSPMNISPETRLARVCDVTRQNTRLSQDLDAMYSVILQAAFTGDFDDEELLVTKGQRQQVLQAIVMSYETLSLDILSRIVQSEQLGVTQMLDSLHAMVDLTDAGDVQILHESLRDSLDLSKAVGSASSSGEISGETSEWPHYKDSDT